MLSRLTLCSVVALLLAVPVQAQTSYPMLMSLHPVAAQRGATSEHTLESRYTMHDAFAVMVSGSGVTGEIVPPEIKADDKAPNIQKLQLKLTVAPDASPGVRELRVVTPRGVSTVGQLVIVEDPVVVESPKNDTVEEAQEVPLPATLCGVIEKAEDVDFYRFHAQAGQSLSFHVRSMRLEDKIHDLQTHSDPILAIRDANGSVLASSDNFFYGDPFVGHVFEQEGDYLIEIRDVRYQGNQYWVYSIEVNSRPFVTNVYPLAVAPGSPTRLDLVGFNLPASPAAEWAPPADCGPGSHWVPLTVGETTSNPAPLIIGDMALSQESAEPNNTFEQAQAVSVPGGVNGRIEGEGDIDCYAFEAKKGETFSFEVVARRQQSALDSHLRVLDATGKQLAFNDDLRLGKRTYADSLVENWTAPADGRYILEVRDMLQRGGPSYVYYLRAESAQPKFELYADTDKTQLAPGMSGALFVRIERKNGFTGEVQLHVDGLPPGVTATCGRILGGKALDGCIVFTAAADAPQGAANIVIRGTATLEAEGQPPRELEAAATIYQETYQPGGGRGHWPVDAHAVAVGAPSDLLEVTLDAYDVTLKPGESHKIGVTIRRAEGFDKNVTLDLLFRHLNSVYGDSLPPGVTMDAGASVTLLTGGVSAGHLTITAAKDAAAVEGQVACVMANVSLNFVMKATYASPPLRITVAP